MDWDLGEYEYVATQLEPAARAVVSACGNLFGQRVLDIGCGTGNAAILAAQRRASVIGIDPAPRLLRVAIERAREVELDISFVDGYAEHLPCADHSVDVIVSVFGLIFSTNARLSAAEIDRVAAIDGEVVYSAWLPGSALASIRRDQLNPALDATSGSAPFSWHDLSAVTKLFNPFGFQVSMREVGLKFVDSSSRSFLDAEWSHNPVWVAARERLRERGTFDEIDAEILEALETANEERPRFAVTSRFNVATLTRTVI